MIFITDELGNIEKNILELVENVGFKDCKTIEAIDLFCGMSEKNDVLKEKDLYYAFIDIPQYWGVRADGLNGAIYDNKTKKAIVFIQLIAGMLIVVYMCDRTTKYGIGGRMSVFMINIVDGMMNMFAGQKADRLILPVIIGVVEIAIMIIIETTEKRIAVQRVSINNIYADKNYLAYKLNPVGAMPLMFTSAVFMLPQFVCSGLYYLHPDNQKLAWLVDNLRLTAVFGIIVYLAIIVLLTILFSVIMLTPGKEAENLLKSGDSILDIYAGKPTRGYLVGTVIRFSIYSSIIICICQGVPLFLQFGGYIDSTLAMLPCSIMMSTGIWISLYREAEVYRNMDRYHPFI